MSSLDRPPDAEPQANEEEPEGGGKSPTKRHDDGEMYISDNASCLQKLGFKILMSHNFERIMGLVIALNFVVVIVETDNNAQEVESHEWVWYASWGLLTTFVIELVMKLLVLRKQFWRDKWNVFDFFVIAIDTTFSLLEIMGWNFLNVSMLRILRLSRLARATKVFRMFPELKLMLAGLVCSFKAIFWGSVLLFTALLVWSVLAVQFIHPLNKDIALTTEVYNGCERCPRAFESTFQACLTFTTQIVAGDSWGRETQPIIEAYPVTGVFFLSVFVSVGLAIMNLILGVVVNMATEARDRILAENESEKLLMANESLSTLLVMCQEMDDDGNDELTFLEIREGFDNNEAFRETLSDMDIGRDDLQIVWTILDSDKSGTVTSKEFVNQIYKMKNSDSQFMLAYIKFYITEIKDKLRGDLKSLGAKMDADLSHLEEEIETNTGTLQTRIEVQEEQIDMDKKKVAAAKGLLMATGMEPVAPARKTIQCGNCGAQCGEKEPFCASCGAPLQGNAPPVQVINNQANNKLQKMEAPTPMGLDLGIDSLFEVGSLKELLQNVHLKDVGKDFTQVKGMSEPTDMLKNLEKVWQQCIVSIDDMRNFHMSLADMLESMVRRVSITIHHTVSASVSSSASKAPAIMKNATALNRAASRECSSILLHENSTMSWAEENDQFAESI